MKEKKMKDRDGVYVAEDGTEFESEGEWEAYEREHKKKKGILSKMFGKKDEPDVNVDDGKEGNEVLEEAGAKLRLKEEVQQLTLELEGLREENKRLSDVISQQELKIERQQVQLFEGKCLKEEDDDTNSEFWSKDLYELEDPPKPKTDEQKEYGHEYSVQIMAKNSKVIHRIRHQILTIAQQEYEDMVICEDALR